MSAWRFYENLIFFSNFKIFFVILGCVMKECIAGVYYLICVSRKLIVCWGGLTRPPICSPRGSHIASRGADACNKCSNLLLISN